MPNHKGILNRLVESNVDFVVVGGFAAVAHGSPLMTMDVDICCDMSWTNMAKLQKAIADLHPVHRMTPRRLPLDLSEENAKGLRNLYLETEMGQLDCLGEIKGLGNFDMVKSLSVKIELEAGFCRVLTLDALIKAKEAMGRPHDKETVKYLREIRDINGDGR